MFFFDNTSVGRWVTWPEGGGWPLSLAGGGRWVTFEPGWGREVGDLWPWPGEGGGWYLTLAMGLEKSTSSPVTMWPFPWCIWCHPHPRSVTEWPMPVKIFHSLHYAGDNNRKWIILDIPVLEDRGKLLLLEFEVFRTQNWSSKMTNQWRYYSANLEKICNIIGPKT